MNTITTSQSVCVREFQTYIHVLRFIIKNIHVFELWRLGYMHYPS